MPNFRSIGGWAACKDCKKSYISLCFSLFLLRERGGARGGRARRPRRAFLFFFFFSFFFVFFRLYLCVSLLFSCSAYKGALAYKFSDSAVSFPVISKNLIFCIDFFCYFLKICIFNECIVYLL